MKKCFYTILTSFLLLFSLLNTANAYDPCFDWEKLIVQYDLENLPNRGPLILVEPFKNHTGKPGDDWLSQGIRLTFADFLNAAGNDKKIITGLLAKHHPKGSMPDYIVGGFFQNIGNTLRIFAKLTNKKGKLIKQHQLDIQSRSAGGFYKALHTTTMDFLKNMDLSIDGPRMDFVRDSTRSYEALSNYVKGRLAFFTLDPKRADVAKILFEESKKADFRYTKAYEGLIDLYTFLGIYNKQHRRAYSLYFEKAGNELAKLASFAGKIPEAEKKSKRRHASGSDGKAGILNNRYSIGNSHFTAGLYAANNNDWNAAAVEFNETVKFIPEDAVTYYHLYQVYTKLGKRNDAWRAYKKSAEINTCLKSEEMIPEIQPLPQKTPKAQPVEPRFEPAPEPQIKSDIKDMDNYDDIDAPKETKKKKDTSPPKRKTQPIPEEDFKELDEPIKF
ncbi:hypothetical protein KKA47_04615 [bacterium]|nr:hypothetical protein [bacterium]